ncbi:hypothetical protein BC829DRAFT_99044 [Chytridium lagenaria]|nr:hypothetical protein BC829DRAFT_99044 [Chytridium lagenaria]
MVVGLIAGSACVDVNKEFKYVGQMISLLLQIRIYPTLTHFSSALVMRSSGSSSKTTHNPLLVRDSVGKTRPSVYDLPEASHVYGKKVERNPEETAAQVLQHWNVKATSKHAIPALDYITMNRNTAKQGINSPKEIRDYRKGHPVRMKVGDNAVYAKLNTATNGETSAELRRQRLIGPLPSDHDKAFAYGKPTRPSTPVACLMTDVYQREWIEDQEKREKERETVERERTKRKQTKTVTPAKVSLPKKILLIDKDPNTLFKLSKFQKRKPKISSLREGVILKTSPNATRSFPKEKNPAGSTERQKDGASPSVAKPASHQWYQKSRRRKGCTSMDKAKR